jgi:hypothetical protein
MRFLAGVFVGAMIARPAVARVYRPFRPVVEEKLLNLAGHIAEKVVAYSERRYQEERRDK